MNITTMTKTLLATSIIALCSFQSIAKEAPPAGSEPKNFSLPATETITLDNGLKVTFIPYGATPKVTLQLRTNTGNIDDGKHVWLSDISYEMLRQGTKNKTAKELAEAVASMGGAIDSAVGMDSSYIGMSVLSEFADDAANVVADLVLNATFAESDLERIKSDTQRRLSVSKSSPASIATEAFYKSIYSNHPYGKFYPTSESINAISAKDTASFISTNLVPNRSHLYVSGVFNKSEVAAAVESAFSEWKKGDIPERKTVITQAGPSLTMLERKDAPQSTIRLGLATISPSHPDYMGLNVMNTLLGGAFSSRITSNIREDKGYTYSPNSSVVTRVGSGLWYQGADVTAEATGASLHEIIKEINLLAKEAPGNEELTGIQNYMAGIFVLRNSSRNAIISQLAFIELHDLDKRYLEDYVKNVYAVSAEDISKVTKKYLSVGNMHLTVVGDTETVAPQLKEVEALSPFM